MLAPSANRVKKQIDAFKFWSMRACTTVGAAKSLRDMTSLTLFLYADSQEQAKLVQRSLDCYEKVGGNIGVVFLVHLSKVKSQLKQRSPAVVHPLRSYQFPGWLALHCCYVLEKPHDGADSLFSRACQQKQQQCSKRIARPALVPLRWRRSVRWYAVALCTCCYNGE